MITTQDKLLYVYFALPVFHPRGESSLAALRDFLARSSLESCRTFYSVTNKPTDTHRANVSFPCYDMVFAYVFASMTF
jgi:hypothetical protein